ncbi:putative nucleic acid-binding protein [Sphaerotilus sulfidivorans]|nr:PIN domain-containing protein [Sphaerotilus sulfidivorans]NZD45526.1 PIN domain-containing protein [Sphaerotilus sulfidivorans]
MPTLPGSGPNPGSPDESSFITLSCGPESTCSGGSRPPRVVIDTAVIVSALVFGGSQSTRLRRAWRHGYCRPMLCRATLIDLMQALARPEFGFTPHEQQTLLGEFLPHALKVRAPGVMPPDASQPLMLPFVQLALAGRAHVLVSADAALLTARGTTLPFPVMALEPFLLMLRDSPINPQPLR